jgi:hypothetical protein
MAFGIKDLAAAIEARQAILFAGAGISMSVGLPSWRDLIAHMCQELGIDDDEIVAKNGTGYQTLAEYYRLSRGSIGPLRSWMDRHWAVSPELVRGSRLHDLIVELDFPIIYTTNYDRNLEVAYELHERPFVKIANAKDFTFATGTHTQIVKFHGDFEDDRSLVLTESDYFDRLSFDSPLDVKLRADALGRTVLFIGYSMTDPNIRLLLHKLWQTWKYSGYERDRPRSYVYMAKPSRIQEAILDSWGITVLTGEADDPGEALTAFLSDLRVLVDTRNREAPSG